MSRLAIFGVLLSVILSPSLGQAETELAPFQWERFYVRTVSEGTCPGIVKCKAVYGFSGVTATENKNYRGWLWVNDALAMIAEEMVFQAEELRDHMSLPECFSASEKTIDSEWAFESPKETAELKSVRRYQQEFGRKIHSDGTDAPMPQYSTVDKLDLFTLNPELSQGGEFPWGTFSFRFSPDSLRIERLEEALLQQYEGGDYWNIRPIGTLTYIPFMPWTRDVASVLRVKRKPIKSLPGSSAMGTLFFEGSFIVDIKKQATCESSTP